MVVGSTSLKGHEVGGRVGPTSLKEPEVGAVCGGSHLLPLMEGLCSASVIMSLKASSGLQEKRDQIFTCLFPQPANKTD